MAKKSGVLSILLATMLMASGSLLTPATAFAESVGQAVQNGEAAPDDYFHTGAGSRYLRRAESDLVVQSLRGNITVLMGSGGNVTVLSRQGREVPG